MVQKFWSLDSVPTINPLSKAEQECEDHFKRTYFRDNTGRFVVKLPFKESTSRLGDSRDLAIRRLKGLEYRLSKQPIIYEEYRKFMREYLINGHMELVSNSEPQPSSAFYLPHHSVIKNQVQRPN